MTNIEYFKFPIEYLDNKKDLSPTIIDDLELVETKDPSLNSIMEIVFKPSHIFSHNIMHKWTKLYTTDKKFLTETQKLIKSMPDSKTEYNEKEEFYKIHKIFEELHSETGFYEKYNYIDHKWFKHFNYSSRILQLTSIYNLTSPIISLLIPFVLAILPFFLLKINGIPLTLSTYFSLLKYSLSKHPLGHIFENFKDAPIDKKLYIVFSISFYIFQIYLNIMACIKFYKNLNKIHSYLFTVRDYVDYTITQYNDFINRASELETYKPFIESLKEQEELLQSYSREIHQINPWKFNIPKIFNIGHVMKCFYKLHADQKIIDCFNYSFGLHGYIDNIQHLNKQYKSSHIADCKFTNKKKGTQFKDAYYPSEIGFENQVKNTYKLNKQLIITGPNAAGKTTLLKTTLFNLIFSQQTGFGFYSSAKIYPFEHFHCYLNIPDTSGRDSLFQAEARRCKEIIEHVEKAVKKSSHFCIFDELYSGTNPYEATSSAISFLKYMNKHKNVTYMLTTHYLELCKHLNNDKCIKNCHMKVIENEVDNSFKYTYKMQSGISSIKGGIKVLNDLNYPSEILSSTKKLIHEIDLQNSK